MSEAASCAGQRLCSCGPVEHDPDKVVERRRSGRTPKPSRADGDGASWRMHAGLLSRGSGLALALWPGVASASCTDDKSDASDPSTSAPAKIEEVGHLVRPADEFVLAEAFDPLPGKIPQQEQPSLDWYAEYEGPPKSSPQRVRLSGHLGDIESVAQEVNGLEPVATMVNQRKALMGSGPDPAGPSVVVFAIAEDQSAMALSYELPVEDLVDWSSKLEIATTAEWIAAGGEVQG